MTDHIVRPGAFAGRIVSGRQPLITVVVLGEEFLGALAYALECALFMPTGVRVVRVGPVSGDERPSLLPVRDLVRKPATSLRHLSASSDRMVAQCRDSVANRVLADLREHTCSPLVEVDANGVVLRVSDPLGRPAPAVAPAS